MQNRHHSASGPSTGPTNSSDYSKRNILIDWYRSHGFKNSASTGQSHGLGATLTHRSNNSESTFIVNPSEEARNQTSSNIQSASQGLLYSSKVTGELASIDKVNDSNSYTLVCAGKSQLETYKFDPENRTIKLANTISQTNSSSSKVQTSTSSFLPKRSRQTKFSTIADVKCGFQTYTHYAAICTNSTSISIFNINHYPSNDRAENPIVCSFDEHKRSVNSFDFNMVQPHLLISGGQDGCAKVWDLRSNHTDGRCEVSINTAYDSIRDIKWMPGYNFGDSGAGQGGSGRSHGGYKFASVHDSGVLLKFDLRQPQQVEGKINAHTGPCLCLNWHPNDDYIATGGRDGKCCLWYIGDKQHQQQLQQQQSSQVVEAYSSINYHQNHLFGEPGGCTGNTQLTSFPETTINFGSPITKLKYAPAFSDDPRNSLLGVSAMGDKSEVMVYSFARRYIPKYYLGTAASSVGFVWWNEDILFNIDKSNHIYGWDITKEPTVLDNLPKIVSTWRDIDGNGFLFVDQKIGTYDTTDPYINKTPATEYPGAQGTSNSNGSANANANGNGSCGSNNNNSNSYGNNNISFPQHMKRSSTHFNLPMERPAISRALTALNSKALLSSSMSSSKSHSSSPSVNSLPLQFCAQTDGGPTEVAQEVATTVSSATLTNTIMRNSSNSSFNLSSGTFSSYSPTIMTLDLPHIFNHMRLSQIAPGNPIGTVRLQESPVELFKYLAKELEFSIEREREESVDGMAAYEGNQDFNVPKDENNEQAYRDLMKKIGLSENGTWANLINTTTTNTSASAKEKFGDKLLHNLSPNKTGSMDTEEFLLSSENSNFSESFDDGNSRSKSANNNNNNNNNNKYQEGEYRDTYGAGNDNINNNNNNNNNSGGDETDYEDDDRSLASQDMYGAGKLAATLNTRVVDIQKRMETLINLVSVANHNAGVYMKVNDKLNCKIWILIRDSILWDLKKMDAFVNENYAEEDLEEILGYNPKFLSSSLGENNGRKRSLRSVSTEYSMSEDIDELLAVEQPREYRESSNTFSEAVEEEEEEGGGGGENRETDTEIRSETTVVKAGSTSEDKCAHTIPDSGNDSNGNDENSADLLTGKRSYSEVLDRRNSDPGDLSINQRRSKRGSFIDTILSADYLPDTRMNDALSIFGSPRRSSTKYFGKLSMSPPSLKSFRSKTPTSFEDLLGQYTSGNKNSERENAGSRPGLEPNQKPEPEPDHNEKLTDDLTGAPWDTGSMLRQIFKQAAETGNILLAISILLLFQDVYHITTIEVVKNSLSEFINLLHRYELFELAAALLKYCRWDDIMGLGEGQSSIQLYCPSCGELIVNEHSKERLTFELQQLHRQRKEAAAAATTSEKSKRTNARLNSNDDNSIMERDVTSYETSAHLTRFGYWYCDLCKRSNTLCILCERPITKLGMGILECGHQGHFECFKEWFIKEGMDTCPGGCQNSLNL